MDFAAMPPETNSLRMYTGPGTGPMLAAAGAWRGLAGELGAAASAYQAAIADLVEQGWFGPASAAMAAAAKPYADWLASTAGLAEHTASRLMLSVNDFEQAFAATVPPPAVAANRSQLAALQAGNVFGQNTAAIAETEAEYGRMWLQDATAMYGYAARSAAATAVQPFTAPPPVADPAGPVGQGATATQAQAGGAHNQLSQLLSTVPRDLQGLSGGGGANASPAAAAAPATDPVSQGASYLEALSRTILPANDANITTLYGMAQYARNLNTDLDISQATGGREGFGSGARTLSAAELPAPAGGIRPVVAASTGNADVVGKLAVPQTWTEAVPEVTMTAAAAPATPSAAAPAGHGVGMAAAGVAATGRAGRKPRRGHRPDRHTERIAGELTGSEEVRHWHAESGGLKNLLGQVSGTPGVHEVYFDSDEPDPPGPGPQHGRG